MQATNFRSDVGLEDGLPLDAGREAGATAAAQPGVGDLLDDLGGGERQRPAQPGPAAVGLVVGDRGRVDHADPGEAHALLRGQPGVLVDHADVRSRSPASTAGHVVGRHVGVADPAGVGLDLDQRLEPEHAARPVADDLGAGRLEGGGHLVGADRDRGGVAGDEHPAGRSRQRQPSVSASSRSADSRPWSRPSSVPDGPSAQLPRQKTSVDLDVAAEAARPRARGVVQRLGSDRLAGLAAAQRDGVRGRRLGAEVVVEADHAVHLGDREVQHVGDRLDVLAGDVAELLHHLVQDRHQRTAVGEVLRGDGADQRGPVGRGRSRHQAAPEVVVFSHRSCWSRDLPGDHEPGDAEGSEDLEHRPVGEEPDVSAGGGHRPGLPVVVDGERQVVGEPHVEARERPGGAGEQHLGSVPDRGVRLHHEAVALEAEQVWHRVRAGPAAVGVGDPA